MRCIAFFALVAALGMVGSLHGQTVRSHSSLRIPTPALDQGDEPAPVTRRDSPAVSSGRSVGAADASTAVETVRAQEASLLRRLDPVNRSVHDPRVSDGPNTIGRTVSAGNVAHGPGLVPVSAPTTAGGVQYFGPSADAVVRSTTYATPASHGAAMTPSATASVPAVVQSTYAPGLGGSTAGIVGTGIAQTSYSVPAVGACCSPGSGPTVSAGMQPAYSGGTFPAAAYPYPTYPSTTVLAPPVADAASYPPSLAGSTIPGVSTSGQAVPYLVNPVAVNIPAVPVDESRLQPIVALRPTVPEESYAGRGILGQPELYVRGQHVRNVLRYLTLW